MAQHVCDDDCDCPEEHVVHAPSPGAHFCRYRPLLWGDVPMLLAIFREPTDSKLDTLRTFIETSDRALSRKLDKIGRFMSALDDVLADLDTATNEVSAKLDAQTAKIADLAAQLAAALPGSEEAAALQAQIDAAVTAIGAESARLHGLAADPADPVPAPVEEPPADGSA